MPIVAKFRIAKAGKSVYSTDPNDFVFREDLNTLKVKATGNLNTGQTYAHGLSYVPIVFFMNKYSSTKGGLIGQDTVGSHVGTANVVAGSSIKYYVFYEQAL